MRINTNVAALNSYNLLTKTNNMMSKSLERLSSGKRINRAADDAAGLAISEKMKGQIKGLAQAQRNAQDAISLIQTAEGALNETHSILQRMRELAIQSANDTNTDADRAELQKEVDELAKELTRIGNNTEFNTQKLIDGTFTGVFHIGANEGQNLKLNIVDMRAFKLGVADDDASGTLDVVDITPTSGTTVDTTDGTYTVALDGDTYQLKDNNGNVVATSTDGKTFTGTGTDGDGSAFGDDSFTLGSTAKVGGEIVVSGQKIDTYDAEISNGGLEPGEYTIKYVAGASYIVDSNGNTVATSTDDTTFVSVEDPSVTVLNTGDAIAGDSTITVGGIDISSQTDANTAISTISDAIQKVSSERAKLGAYQNRLEHTINNLSTAEENLTAANSRIEDLDMAQEMMTFTKAQILSQAGTAMLAQANMVPQGILQLLR